jgi:Glycosyltransferase family 87
LHASRAHENPDISLPVHIGPVTAYRIATTIRLRTLPFAFAASLLLFGSLASQYFGRNAAPNRDFLGFYFAAEVVRDNPHGELYRGNSDQDPELSVLAPIDSPIYSHAKAAGQSPVSRYLYPPLLADLLIPLTHWSAPAAAAAWRMINLVLIFTSLILLAQMLRIGLATPEFALVAACTFFFYPIHESLWSGNVSVVLMALWVVALFAYDKGWVVLSAFALAFATVLKVTPIAIFPLFVVWKDRRWLAAYFASLLCMISALAAFNGLPAMRMSWDTLVAMVPGDPKCDVKCIGSLLTWIYFGSVKGASNLLRSSIGTSHGLLVAIRILSFAFYAACLFPVWIKRGAMSRSERVFAISIFAVVALCVSPVSWRQAYAMALPALAICWTKALRQRLSMADTNLLAFVTAVLGTLFLDVAATTMPMPEAARIALSGLWIVLSVGFCLFALWRWNEEKAWLPAPPAASSV